MISDVTQRLEEKVRGPLTQRYGDRLQAVVVFGSVVAGQARAESDVDLLVVMTGLPPKRAWRRTEMVKLRELLKSSRPLDILLVTPEECRANFENHNPLYLDIAFDGIILLDRGMVTKLIEQTKTYVARRGIIRRKTGWRFPVEYRRATPLDE